METTTAEPLTLTESRQQVMKPEEVLAASLKYFNGDDLAATTWINKYAMKDRDGNCLELTPADMHRRMAREFQRIENKYDHLKNLNGHSVKRSSYGQIRDSLDEEKIFSFLDHFRYVIPQGSVMAALGNPNVIASLSNCIVLPELHDSYGGIFFADQQLAQLFKRRCGAGLDLSTVRPEGMQVSNAARTSTGAVSFMERFSATTREVAQNGRRGALMITMDVAHPDIEQFISIKQDLQKVTGANISVKLSDEFMEAVEKKGDFILRFPVDAVNPVYTKKVKAVELWDLIIRCAHQTAEPGIIFWDRQHDYSTSSVYPGFKNTSTNPCSEIAMQGGDSCRLISLNLSEFVIRPFQEDPGFDFKKFYQVTYEAQRLMDDLVDLELEAIERILTKIESDPEPGYIKDVELRTWKLLYDAGKKGRRTGLGFTALGDTLASLNLRYDSEEALQMTEKIMHCKCEAEFDSSIDMALERGTFEGFDPDVEKTSAFVQMMEREMPVVYKRMMEFGRRNISISTVAPAGSISLLARTSSGIEPVFMLSYKRRRKIGSDQQHVKIDFIDSMGDRWQEFTVNHPKFAQWMETTGSADPDLSPYAGSTAAEISWENRIRMQAVVQKYTTHSISSTINLAAEVSPEQVGAIYKDAWKKGLKGITVYRDGSRSGVLIAEKKQKKTGTGIQSVNGSPSRPKMLEAAVVRFNNAEEKWIAYVGLVNEKPYEVFTGKAEDAFSIPAWVEKGWIIKNKIQGAKSRYDFQYMDKEGFRVTIEGLSRSFNKEFWNYAKLISGVLRYNMPLPQVVHLIDDLHLYSENINTWKAGVVRALKSFIPDGSAAVDRICTECHDPEGLIYEEGCLKCKSCGHTKCG